jgi:hypothetical protein
MGLRYLHNRHPVDYAVAALVAGPPLLLHLFDGKGAGLRGPPVPFRVNELPQFEFHGDNAGSNFVGDAKSFQEDMCGFAYHSWVQKDTFRCPFCTLRFAMPFR